MKKKFCVIGAIIFLLTLLITVVIWQALRPVTDEKILQAVKARSAQSTDRLLSKKAKTGAVSQEFLNNILNEAVFPPTNPALVKVLLKHGARPSVYTVKMALEDIVGLLIPSYSLDDQLEVGKTLLDTGVDQSFLDQSLLKIGNNLTPKAMQLLLDYGANPNAKDKKGKTALMYANGRPASMKLLLEHGADTEAKNEKGETLLLENTRQYSGRNGNLHSYTLKNGVLKEEHIDWNEPTLEVLLNFGANINVQDRQGNTPLLIAIQKKDIKIANLLLAKGAATEIQNQEGYTAALQVVQMGESFDWPVTLLTQLKEHGANFEARDPQGNTVLLLSVLHPVSKGAVAWKSESEYKSDLLVTPKYLSKNGANVKAVNNEGENVIMLAVRSKNKDQLEWLLQEKFVDINARNNKGQTALHIAAQERYYLIESLLKAGADIEAKDAQGKTPLMTAVESNSGPSSSILIKNGASVKAVNNEGENVIMLAVRSKNKDRLEWFLQEKFVDINARNNKGQTALHIAAQECYYLIESLLKAGADIEAKDAQGKTPLMTAVESISGPASSILIKNGASLRARDKEGNTPLMCAVKAKAGRGVFDLLILSDNSDWSTLKNKKGQTVRDLARATGDENTIKYFDGNEPELRKLLLIKAVLDNDKDKVVHLITKAGLSANTRGSNNTTLLMYAAGRGYTGIMRFLLNTNAFVNTQSDEGNTALIYAASMGNITAMEMLIAKKADINLVNKEGLSALSSAVLNDQLYAVQLLLQQGALNQPAGASVSAEELARQKNNKQMMDLFRKE